jgi:hypothetical protein
MQIQISCTVANGCKKFWDIWTEKFRQDCTSIQILVQHNRPDQCGHRQTKGRCRKLYDEEPNNVYCSSYCTGVIKSRKMRYVRRAVRIRQAGIAHSLAGKLEGKRPLGSYRRSWEDNVKRSNSVKLWLWYITQRYNVFYFIHHLTS